MRRKSLVVRPGVEEEKQDENGAEDSNDDHIEEISPERWRQAQQRWRRDREQYRKELAEKDAEVERLRAEVERFKRQRIERDNSPMEEERKESPDAGGAQGGAADAGGAQRTSRVAEFCRERAEGLATGHTAKDVDSAQKEASPCQVI